MYDAMLAETVTIAGEGGERIDAYLARPLGPGPYAGVVVVHHMPGWDQWSREVTRRFATLGYNALCPHLHSREDPGGQPDVAASRVRQAGGVPDQRLVGDAEGAARYLRTLSNANGRIGVIGYCSGGRQAFLAACRLPFDAAVDCYGAFVAQPAPEEIGLAIGPVIDEVDGLSCPLLGLFGVDDLHPSPAEVEEMRGALTGAGKEFELHSYEGAGHAFFNTERESYRPLAATDGWARVSEWFHRYLDG